MRRPITVLFTVITALMVTISVIASGCSNSNQEDKKGNSVVMPRGEQENRKEEVKPKEPIKRDTKGDVDPELTIKRLRDEIAELNGVIEKAPKDMNALYLRGNAKRGLGDLKGAIADYDKAINIAIKAGLINGENTSKVQDIPFALKLI